MNSELEKASAEAVKQLTQYLSSGVDFAKGQAPDIAREILLWGRVEQAILFVVGVALGFLAHWCFRRSGQIVRRARSGHDTW